MENFFRENGVKWLWERIKTLLSAKQDKLVSGTNIKTINGTSLLGSGNVTISGGSGGGDFDSSGTYPNLTAGKATKLATARTISLSGGASGSVSFDGSANRSLDVTGLKEAYLTAGGRNITYGYSMLDGMATVEGWNNRLSYWNTDYITVEYTNNYTENEDGTESAETIWTDYFEGKTSDDRKKILTTIVTNGLTGYVLELTGAYATPCIAEQSRLRVTIEPYSGRYFVGKKILTRLSRGSTSYNDQLIVEKVTRADYNNGNTENWVKVTQDQVAGDSGWNSFATPISNFGISQYASTRRLRLTYIAKTSREHGFAVSQIRLIGDNVFETDDALAKTGFLYTWDIDKNATFPAAITATKHVTQDGTSNQVVLGDGSLKSLSEIGKTYSVVTTSADGLMSKGMYAALKDGFITNIVNVTTNESNVELSYNAAYPNGDGTFTIAEGEGVEIPLATTTTAGVMSAADKIKLDGFDGFNTAKDYVGADVADGVYGRNNYIDLSGKGLNEGDIIIVTHKNGNYVAYAMLIWTDGGMLEIKNESTPVTTISTQHPYIIFSSVQATDEITVRKIQTTRL